MLREEPTRILDLFAGAGGLSLGFEHAGFEIYAAMESDSWACETLQKNHPTTKVLCRDITSVTDDEVRSLFGDVRLSGIVGGPPCQGFSHSNITKRDIRDPRNSLFREFARFVRILRPDFLLMENVPGLLRTRLVSGEYAIDVIKREFETIGYSVEADILKAELFGVPQIRERLFILGVRDRKLSDPFPRPTHSTTAVEHQNGLFDSRPAITLWDAISDLPSLESGEGTDPSDYEVPPQNDYQWEMRNGNALLWNHVAMRHSKRVVERFRHIQIGQSQSDVSDEHAPRVRSNGIEVSSKRYDQNNRRLAPNRPSHTIPASFYANFVHPYQHRNFTPREGARIQSFPDHYVFCGKPTVVSHKLLSREGRLEEKHLCQYVQIGNAVPPKLAKAIGENILRQL